MTVKKLLRREPLGGARFGRGLSLRTLFARSAAFLVSASLEIPIWQPR